MTPQPGARRGGRPFGEAPEPIVVAPEYPRHAHVGSAASPSACVFESRGEVCGTPIVGPPPPAERRRDEVEVAASEPRPTRFHANAKTDKATRRFDTTALHYDLHAKILSHADYIAHSEKYDYAWRSIKQGDRILDVGCGTDLSLMLAICYTQAQASKVLHRTGGCYVGVDLNKLPHHDIGWATLLSQVDVTSDEGYDACLRAIPGNQEALDHSLDLRGYSLVVCLEVIEHMDVPDGRRLLETIRDLMSPDGRVILSTPVFDGKAMARNHLHEYYVDELRELIESVGLRVERRMGTFTAEPALKRWLRENRPDWLKLYDEAREFHSAGYMSGVLAPMLPDISRNNVWDLRRA